METGSSEMFTLWSDKMKIGDVVVFKPRSQSEHQRLAGYRGVVLGVMPDCKTCSDNDNNKVAVSLYTGQFIEVSEHEVEVIFY